MGCSFSSSGTAQDGSVSHDVAQKDGGAVPGCKTATDSCDDGNACTLDSCDEETGSCNHDDISTPSSQIPGDCQRITCDAGTAVLKDDDTDVPDDENDCTVGRCAGGIVLFDARPIGSACNQGGGSFCDGSTSTPTCVECNFPSDCPAPENECEAPICLGNTCGIAFAGFGTPTSLQTNGDCQHLVCDGGGDTTSVDDDDDLPVDGLDCTDDVCASGTPSNPPEGIDTPCGLSGIGLCDGAGTCVGCNEASDCGVNVFCQTFTCVDNVCDVTNKPEGEPVPEQTGGDCLESQCDDNGQVQDVADDTDLPASDGNDCTDDLCSTGSPTHPPLAAETPCITAAGWVCNGAGDCVECATDTQCTLPSTCDVGGTWSCGCVGNTCSGLGLTCGTVDNGCGVIIDCNNGIKDGTETDVDCGGNAATCPLSCSQGLGCATGPDCQSTFCADEVCCDKVCTGDCESCLQAFTGEPTDGECANVIAGQDPRSDCTAEAALTCGGTGECDGGGACELYPSSTSCSNEPTCAPAFCDGSGTCSGLLVLDGVPCSGNGGDACCGGVCTDTGGTLICTL